MTFFVRFEKNKITRPGIVQPMPLPNSIQIFHGQYNSTRLDWYSTGLFMKIPTKKEKTFFSNECLFQSISWLGLSPILDHKCPVPWYQIDISVRIMNQTSHQRPEASSEDIENFTIYKKNIGSVRISIWSDENIFLLWIQDI